MQPTDLYKKLQEERFKHAQIRLFLRELHAIRDPSRADPTESLRQSPLQLDGILEEVTDHAFHLSQVTTSNIDTVAGHGRLNRIDNAAYVIVPLNLVYFPVILKHPNKPNTSSQP